MNRNNKSQPNATFRVDSKGGFPIMLKANVSIKYKTEFATRKVFWSRASAEPCKISPEMAVLFQRKRNKAL